MPNGSHTFRAARRDPELAVLEGFHALKHAVRFGAEVERVLTTDAAALAELAGELAPDVRDRIAAMAETVDAARLAELAPRPPETGVVAIARRSRVTAERILADTSAPVVLLENPRNLANLGACVRVAAAAEAAHRGPNRLV
ncbi:MAG: hypothetical protein M3340_19560, partial [Actinomycetota bacterium]|nr:hypothetical protein [Actinomycetota bacterium]